MDSEYMIQEDGTVIVPKKVREWIGVEIEDKIKWRKGDGFAIIESAAENDTSEPTTAKRKVSRRILLKGVLNGAVSYVTDKSLQTIDDNLWEYMDSTDSPGGIAEHLLNLEGKIAIVTGQGAPEIEDLGEIDYRSHAKLASFLSRVMGSTEISVVDEIGIKEVDHLATTTGPLGSDLTALSMGYHPKSLGRYRGRLPYVFDLAPSKEYDGLSLDEIRDRRTNWPIIRTYGDSRKFTPKKREDGSTLGNSDRPKYSVDYGIVTVKQVFEGWEQYETIPELARLTKLGDNQHIIVSGCHGEGTWASTLALTQDTILKQIYNSLQDLSAFQLVIRANIDHYEKAYDKNGEKFFLPEFSDISLETADRIPR